MQDTADQPSQIIQPLIYDTNLVEELSILIVGVGGIGCELLKVLCKMRLKAIHIIDMDTIQLSNLNRQFLFKTEHKGLSKSLVAREAVKKINPFLNIHAHHMNIKELPIEFYKQFNFLVMALDNIDARNYVNKVGVRLNIPVLDAGTLAYKGNVRMIIPGETCCYSCEPKVSSQKSFPVCTIRMRPEKPIHCIVWAKMLFEVFFSGQEVNNDMKDLASLAQEGQESKIIHELLHKEILTIKEAKTDSDSTLAKDFVSKIHPIPQSEIISTTAHPNLQEYDSFDNSNLTNEQNIAIAKRSFIELMKQLKTDGSIVFEKDDDNIIHFISSMANLRMKCFAIEQQSFNEIKNMAGNIVPAIASTNSIVSGLEVIQMFKLFLGNNEYLKSYYVQNQSQKVRALKVEKPLPTCTVCSVQAAPVGMEANFAMATFRNIVEVVDSLLEGKVEEYSINLGQNQLYNSEQPNKILMGKTIHEIAKGSYELDLNIMDQDNSEKIGTLWVTHSELNLDIQVTNQNQFTANLQRNKSHRQLLQMQKQQQEKKAQTAQNEDSDIVMHNEGEDSDDLVVVEAKKKDPEPDQERDIADVVEKRVNPDK